MERVGAEGGVRAGLGHDLGDVFDAVGADQADRLAALVAEQGEEGLEGGSLFAGRGPYQAPGVVVDHHGQELVAPLVGDLVDADAAQPVEGVDRGSGRLATTRVMIAPTVRHATRICSTAAAFEVWVASQATWSSKARV